MDVLIATIPKEEEKEMSPSELSSETMDNVNTIEIKK